MNLEAINKWLDEEYGCSFTRLEELHDFYFEKYCDLKKENRLSKEQLEELDKKLFFTKNELDMRQKSIDNKLNQQKKFIEYLTHELNTSYKNSSRYYYFSLILSKFKEIIGDNK